MTLKKLIIEIDENLKKQLLLKCINAGKTIRQYVTEIIEKDINGSK